jgi:hypothetical protein
MMLAGAADLPPLPFPLPLVFFVLDLFRELLVGPVAILLPLLLGFLAVKHLRNDVGIVDHPLGILLVEAVVAGGHRVCFELVQTRTGVDKAEAAHFSPRVG